MRTKVADLKAYIYIYKTVQCINRVERRVIKERDLGHVLGSQIIKGEVNLSLNFLRVLRGDMTCIRLTTRSTTFTLFIRLVFRKKT